MAVRTNGLIVSNTLSPILYRSDIRQLLEGHSGVLVHGHSTINRLVCASNVSSAGLTSPLPFQI